MTDSMTEMLDKAFGHPRGLLGRIGALVMTHGNGPTEHHVVEVAKLTPEESVLVVGPGPGVGLEEAAKRAARVIGVDPSEEMLGLCRERCGDGVELRKGTAEETGEADAAVDVVLSVNNVHHWEDRAAGIAELFRVLKPGGRLVLSAHEKWLPVSRHLLAEELETAGFADVQTWTWDPPGFGALAAQLRARKPR